jgi:hypothetical protein
MDTQVLTRKRPDAERHTQSPEVLFEEARRRRRRRWAAGSVAGAILAVAALAYGGSGGGRGSSLPAAVGGTSGSPSLSGLASNATAFPGAPQTQAQSSSGVETGWWCPVAAANHYLPAHSGCVTVMRADVNADGRPDLIVVYSRLSSQRFSGPDVSAKTKPYYRADSAHMAVYFAGGGSASTRIDGARAAVIVAAAHVNGDPGSEVFLQLSQISSGATAVAYGFHDGQLVPAGVTLSYGGDSATHTGFNCITGEPPHLIQRDFELIGPTIYGSWRETDITYDWEGPKLVQTAKQTFKEHGSPPISEVGIGAGCKARPE